MSEVLAINAAVDQAVTIHVFPWSDTVVEGLGYPVESRYVEFYWLPTIGPTGTWLARRLSEFAADHDVEEPATVHLPTLAAMMGVPGTGSNSPIRRTLSRLCHFGVVQARADGLYAVRSHLAPITRSQLDRLPEPLVFLHETWGGDI